ncbi:MAG: hypothetical protein JO261_16210 [Alphaproteobacteria bacterium]|nr:hypothetical protein [Alphaproteobacteria bacterium]
MYREIDAAFVPLLRLDCGGCESFEERRAQRLGMGREYLETIGSRTVVFVPGCFLGFASRLSLFRASGRIGVSLFGFASRLSLLRASGRIGVSLFGFAVGFACSRLRLLAIRDFA